MISQVSQSRLRGFRFLRSIISYAVWAYHRFALSLRDVEDLLAERGVIGWNPCVNGLHGDVQAGSRPPSGCCWNERSDSSCWSGKWIDEAHLIFDQQSVVHILSPQRRASSDQRGRHDHRVIDR